MVKSNKETVNIYEINLIPSHLRGLDRYDARKAIIDEINNEGLAVTTLDESGSSIPYVENKKIMQPMGDRSNVVIEPMLTDQWYVAIEELAKPAIEALWWGHRIPAWYDENDKIYVGKSEAAVREKYSLADDIALRQDEDCIRYMVLIGLMAVFN
ncbi:Valine--tRNA ligase [Nymphon striatum]|nr:Valine--tRNA ligase [Nymphon striatum]